MGGDSGVSIHAPAWGATRGPRFSRRTKLRFNSRSRMGSDEPHFLLDVYFKVFQFTLPHGERLWSTMLLIVRCRFQFTLPHGERLDGCCTRTAVVRFNSRSRMGSDSSPRYCARLAGVSIHAPAWGATRACVPSSKRRGFNSRSRMGSDLGAMTNRRDPNVSIHAPAWGATRPTPRPLRRRPFQFTLPHGERRPRPR